MTKNVLNRLIICLLFKKVLLHALCLKKKTQKAKTKHIKTTTNINSNIWHKVN